MKIQNNLSKLNNHYYNEITDICDEYLIDTMKEILLNTNICNYILYYGYCKGFDTYVIRYPGATRGEILVDKNNIIKNIFIYDDEYHTDDIYKKGLNKELQKFIGTKLVFKNKEE